MYKIIISLIIVLFFTTSFYKFENTKQNSIQKNLPNNFKRLIETESDKASNTAEELFSAISFANFNSLRPEVFYKAFLGFENLKKAGKLDQDSHLFTICDFSLSSTEKRLWVIDLNEKKIVFNSLVAHGKNTGEEFATNFSNTESSLQSSMGFFITETTYNGANGYSLKLIGMDEGFNDAALQRAIVMHGADYVSEEFIKNQKRLGRSWGCPAVPRALAEPIINTIKGKNCLFIYYPDSSYLSGSQWLKKQKSI
ncbi:murein L,D-transpeptidase catalytic domain family protein [Chryseobacterium sp. MP_3.2]|uniref:murein L,D-transpeptidase catalytic domain family protein n=1 Tax=Chryseobacterium sp. MP_3.2 TaxID=3071712 RepID=UPI002E068CE0|nr:hypothetical protein [Chryseobacterium sp. MP_3.2]